MLIPFSDRVFMDVDRKITHPPIPLCSCQMFKLYPVKEVKPPGAEAPMTSPVEEEEMSVECNVPI